MTQFAAPALVPETPLPRLTHLAPSPDAMRRALGAFPSGVTVVTSLDDDEPVGFACQSFASLSLDPPLVLFCASRSGRSWARIRDTGRWCVNVLGEHQVEMCERFGSPRGERFAGLDWERTDHHTPALPEAVLRVHCTLEDVHVAGDHDIAVGRVDGLEVGASSRPLVFHRGRFGLDAATAAAPNWWGWREHWG